VSDLFLRFGIALGLGLLVGLQRERVHRDGVAGFRTFGLISLTGAVCGRLSLGVGGWVVAAGLLALCALLVVAYYTRSMHDGFDHGLTTEVAALLMFSVGVYAALGRPVIAVAVGGITAALLQWKEELHGLAARIGDDDIRGVMQFVVISMVVLPVLPNRAMGPYGVINPRQVWWMVVLIVGLSLLGYVANKLIGARRGTLLTGVLGGLVSSTATTVTFARRNRAHEVSVQLAAAVILVASAIVYLRVLVLLGVVWPELLRHAWGPMLVMLVVLGGLAAMVTRWRAGGEHEEAPHQNPTNLVVAMVFAALYALILLAAAWAKDRLGSGGLFAVAAISGLVDVDAITLSTAQLARGGRIGADLAWRLPMLATLVNLVFKAVLARIWGGPALLRSLAAWFGIALLAGTALLLLWPGPAAPLAVR